MPLGIRASRVYKRPVFFIIVRDHLRPAIQDGASGLRDKVVLSQTFHGHIHIPMIALSKTIASKCVHGDQIVLYGLATPLYLVSELFLLKCKHNSYTLNIHTSCIFLFNNNNNSGGVGAQLCRHSRGYRSSVVGTLEVINSDNLDYTCTSHIIYFSVCYVYGPLTGHFNIP